MVTLNRTRNGGGAPDTTPSARDYDHSSQSDLDDTARFRNRRATNDHDNNDDWVDEDTHQRRRGSTSSSTARTTPSISAASPRKRRFKTPIPGSPNMEFERSQNEQPPRKPFPVPTLIHSDEVIHHTLTGIRWAVSYTFSIVRPAIRLLRIPLSLILFTFLMAAVLNRVASTLSAAFAPVCYIPGLSSTPACRWVHSYSAVSGGRDGVRWADYPALVEVQSKTFEQMLDDSMGSSSLSLDMKKTEMATADLIALVRLSNLASRESLAETLSEFVADAKNAGRSLHRLDAKMNGALDSIMAMNDYAYTRIEGARANEPGRFALALWKPQRSSEEVVTETFNDAMNVLSEHLERLLLELESNYSNLDRLEEKLGTLRDIVGREDKRVTADKEELLSYLWTKLGGNRKDLRNFNRNLKMLQDLTVHRKQANARVVATLHTLQAVSQDMEDMRERVAAPNLAGTKIAPEVHMKSIKNGLERLREGRSRAKKIEEDVLRRALGIGND
ncbi:hypothetical protein DFP72DRAFT_1007111 [Ephemerocybe angulata]|uniref:Uncharacterized protein n=1 Tax=Ephemerocybe angulata TaxID=980116 RepID=A0A8H6I3C7_9AGAR|nr:hypothetical protein DFP72DRAFT_1007111 [Tulosesus angulatus]